MKIRNIILLLSLLINYSIGKAQCSFSYSKDICGEMDISHSSIQLFNGDFVFGGSGGCGANPGLTVLSRINCKGETIWYRSYPENNAYGGVRAILQIDSNTLMIGAGGIVPRLFKVNLMTGEIINDLYNYIPVIDKEEYSGGENIFIHQKYIYATVLNLKTYNKYFLVKLNCNTLEICWMKEFSFSGLENDMRVIVNELLDFNKQEIGVAGYIHKSNKIFIQIFDTSGTPQRILYPFDSLDSRIRPSILHRTSQSKNQNINMVLRYVGSSSTKLAVIDTAGNIIKYQSYDDVTHFIETKDGGYAVCGSNDLIRKLDSNFQTVYDIKSKWPGSWYFTVGEAQDGGLFATGMANIFATDGDMAFIKAEPHGGINSVQEVQDITTQIQTTPNPATTQVHIESPIKIESYTLNNTSGTQVQSGVLDATNNIDISQLPQGIYFLQLQLENGQRVVKKLVRSY
jgi:hypothetical protein